MATTISPNMGLPIPNVAQEPGPAWAKDINASLSILDGHNHTPGNGVQIPPSGLDINNDLTFQGNNATNLRSTRYTPQSLIPGVTPDIGITYVSGVDLYYNDGNGNQIRITQSGSVAGSSGTITGLPSGTASAAYIPSSGTFVFQQATATAANMDIATVILRYPGSYPTPAGNFIALEAPASLATGYAFTLPNNTPALNQSAIVSDTSGNLSYMTPNDIYNARTTTIGSTVGVGGVAISGSSGNFSSSLTTFNTIPNLFVTITTAGRPVRVFLMADNSGNNSNLSSAASGGQTPSVSFFRILRDGSPVCLYTLETDIPTVGNCAIVVPSSTLSILDTPGAGIHTYAAQMASLDGNITSGAVFTFLVAYEI